MIAGYEDIENLCRTAGSDLGRGRHPVTGSPVLLKLLPEQAPPESVARFRREYDLLQAIDVPGVPKPVTFIERPGSMAIVMKAADGESLETVLRRRRFDLRSAIEVAIRLTGILAGIHAARIVHHDFRPVNLLISPAGSLFLVDLHFAARENEEAPAPGATDLFPWGLDPAYLSPEQTGRINRSVDYRTDFYSLGVLLFRLLTGRLPFETDERSEWAHRLVACPPRSPAELVAEVPQAVSDLVMKLLDQEPDDRYQSAEGLHWDLQRLLTQLDSTGGIVPFPLGTRDVRDRLRIPQRLYGREKELETLNAVFGRVAETGWPEVMMISGGAGTGKSSLVHELRPAIERRRGYFCAGKFDPFQRDVPYAAMAAACHSLMQQILMEEAAQVAARRRRLQQTLGTSGALMIDFVPLLTRIIGPQPAVAELPPAEAQNRFHAVFQRFIEAVVTAEHPLVLFLDDLQWLDRASLKLIESLIIHPDTRHLVIIGAFRPDEIDSAHPLPQALTRIAGAGVKVLEIMLSPLFPEDLNRFIADTLQCVPERAAPLAALLFSKSGGNPFFFIQLLRSLHRQRLIVFDPQQRGWTWDLASIETTGLSDHVMELLARKLKHLDQAAEELLRLAGCLGSRFEIETLARIWDRSAEETEHALASAVQEGVVVCRNRKCHFVHDHFHQAACELIPRDQRDGVHLKIGRVLQAHTPPDAVDDHLFEIVTQLNLGRGKITTADERTRVAELNLRAARRAKKATAYQAAASYLAAGARLLGCDSWERQDPLAFSIFLERAECEFLCGHFERAEHLFPALLRNARTRLERAAVYRIKIDTLTTAGKDEEAIESALECLRVFDVDIPRHPAAAEVRSAYDALWSELGDRPIGDLVDLPLAEPEVQAAMDILARLYAPAYHLDNNLFYLHLCQGVRISLRHGNSPASVHAYGWFGVVLTCVFHRPQEGCRFARLALELTEREPFLAYKARALFVLRIIAFWTGPLDRMLEYARTTFEAAVETGDVPGACFSRNHTVMGMLIRGDHLTKVHREAESAIEFVRRAGFRDVQDMLVGIERLVQAMRGNTPHLATFDDERFSEAAFEAELTPDRMPTLLFYYQVVKLMARYLAGDFQGALAAGAKSRELMWAGLFSAHGHLFHYYHALTLAAVFDTLPPGERGNVVDVLGGHRESLRQAAEGYPPTFSHAYALAAAEIARIEGRAAEAERLYDEAVRSAKEHGFIQDQGLASELAGRFHHGRGLGTIADGYLRQARDCYQRWGAGGKVRQLDTSYPHLATVSSPVAVTCDGEQLLGTLAVLKASEAIARQILLHPLLDTLMRNVMASAGARKGALLLLRPDGLVLAAEAQVREAEVEVKIHRERRDFASMVPVSLLDYVRRTREKVVFADSASNRFAADDYYSRQHPESVLCLPIICRAELIGLLYLENDPVPNLFTPERIAVLELLAAQAAISLENARLYRDLRQENVERRRADRALRESETRFRTGFAHAVIGMALLDVEGRFTQVNRSLCEMLGYTETELLGRNFVEITDPEDVASSVGSVRQLLAGESESFQATKRYRHKEGDVIWAEVSVALIRPGNGETASLVAQIQDITERRRAEEALQENRRLLQSLIDNSSALIYVKDLEGRYLLANRRCEEIFHIVAGRTDYDLLPKERADAIRDFDRQVVAAGTVLQREEEAPLADGLHHYISVKAPLRDASGTVYALCGVSTDITELKKQERHQAAQYAIAGVLAGSSSLADAAPRLLQILCQSLSWELGEIWIVDPKAGLIRHMESWCVPSLEGDEFVQASRGAAYPSGVGLPGRVWKKGAPEWVPDVPTDKSFMRAADADRAGLHGAFAFPVRVGRQILGAMAFFSREMRQPDEDLLEILTTIGNQIGQFVERKRAEEELRFSEGRYRTLHRDNPTMIFTLDAEGTILSTNPFGANQLGYSIEELEGKSLLDIFHEDDRRTVAEQLQKCLQNPDKVYRWHMRKICRDGALLWVEELAQAIYGQDGALNVLVVCQDITERRRAEEALRQQEERFRYVALATRDAIYDWDIVTDHLWFNDTLRELYRAEETTGTSIGWWEQHLHPDDRPRIVESLREAFQKRQVFWSDEYRFRRFDGSFASIVDRGYILYSDEGEPVRMIGAMTDVTERRKALVEAEAARDKIAAILKSVGDGLLVTDLADRLVLVNEPAEALLGISLAGTSWRHIDSLPIEESLQQQIAAVRSGELEKGSIEWERPEAGTGRVRVLQAQTAVVHSAEGRRSGTITLVRDVTREREIDRMKNEFISTAAHELRTPLTTVMGYLQLLREEERFTPDERKEFLQLVYEKSEVLDRIIRDLLDLSRVQTGRLVAIDKVREDFAAVVRHAIAAYRGVTDRHNFRQEFPEETVEVCLDPVKIGQVLDNLLSNAVKFSPAGGTIRVIGRRSDGEFQTTVADEGIGMDAEQVEHVFDKFYRADASNTAVSGLGLGMSIVKNIIEAHGGRIWVESEPGRGTRVHFTLPVGSPAEVCAQ